MRLWWLAGLLLLSACQDLPAPRAQCSPVPAFTAAPLNACTGSARVRMTFVGDVLLHRQLQRYAYAGGLPLVWKQAAPFVRWADIAVANLEGPVAAGMGRDLRLHPDPGPVFGTGVYSGYPQFNYHPMILGPLRDLGIDLVTTANNHALDRGGRGVDMTLAALDRAGIAAVGSVRSNDDGDGAGRGFTRLLPSRLGTLAFVACSFSTNGIADPGRQVLRCFRDRETLLALVRKAAGDPAIAAVIVLPHWGVEYAGRPAADQMALARDLVQAGASAVIGTHPHAVQPLDVLDGAGGARVPVAYSTGNFIAVQNFMPAKVGALVTLELCRNRGAKLAVGNIGWIAGQMEFTGAGIWLDIAPPATPGPRGAAYRHLSRIAPGFSAQPAVCAIAAARPESAP